MTCLSHPVKARSSVFTQRSDIYRTQLWVGLCVKCKVSATRACDCLAFQRRRRRWMEERPLLSSVRLRYAGYIRAAVHHPSSPTSCCVYSFPAPNSAPSPPARLCHVWLRRADRCRGENHQQQTQDRQCGKTVAAAAADTLSYQCVCIWNFLTCTTKWTESSFVKAKTNRKR